MVWTSNVLVVASVTATSRELLHALEQRSESSATAVTLVVPAPPFGDGRSAAKERLRDALAALREVGLKADGHLGGPDPMVAVTDAWDPNRYDEIIVSTLPASVSKWLGADLPRRIERHTGAIVTHVVSQPPRSEPAAVTVSKREKLGVVSALSTLTWGS
ncbi:MAG: hypothetical protein ACLPV4_11215 [Solirubrobacteraceae bacterium]